MTENSTSTTTSVPSSSTWLRALSSMPVTQIQVMARMKKQPRAAIGPVVVRQVVEAEQQERVLRGDAGQVRHDHQVGHDDAPAAQPAGSGPQRPGGPGERGAAVRVGPVHVEVRRGDERHRDERHQHDRRRLQADLAGHVADRRRERVAGCGGRHPDDDGGGQPEGPGLEALARHRAAAGLRVELCGQGDEPPCRPVVPLPEQWRIGAFVAGPGPRRDECRGSALRRLGHLPGCRRRCRGSPCG